MQYPSSRLERRQQPPSHASFVRGGGSRRRRRHGSRPQPRSPPSTSCLSHQPVRPGADLRLVVRSGPSNEAAATTSADADAATAASSSGSGAPAEQPCGGGGRVRRPAATGDGGASAAPPAPAASAAGSHKGVPRRRRWWRGGDSSRDAPSTLPGSHAAAAADFPLPAAGGSAATTTSTAAGRLWNLSLGRYHWPATSAAAATAATAAASSWTSSQPFSPAPAERHAPPQPSQLPDGNEGLFFGPPTIRRKYFPSLHWTVFAQYLFRFILPSFSSPPRLSLPTSLEEIWHLTTAGPQRQSSSSNSSSSSLRSCRTLTLATLFCRGTGSPDDFSVEKP